VQHESDAAHGVNQLFALFRVDLSPQSRDVNVNDVVERCGPRRFLPDITRQALTRHHLTLMAEKVLEQLELARSEIDDRSSS
jgi:hypothetical protein